MKKYYSVSLTDTLSEEVFESVILASRPFEASRKLRYIITKEFGIPSSRLILFKHVVELDPSYITDGPIDVSISRARHLVKEV